MPPSACKDGARIPDAPLWILRHHAPTPVHSLRIVEHHLQPSAARLLAAGDSEGRISLTPLADYRPRHFWRAHGESILGVDVQRVGADNVMLSSGRDNQLHMYALPTAHSLTSAVLPSRMQSELPVPDRLQSLAINALNYCPSSAVPLLDGPDAGLLVAVPHTVDAGYIDVFHLPSKKRLAAAVGKADIESAGVKKAASSRAPMVMSLHLLSAAEMGAFRIVAGYEDGCVRLWTVKDGAGRLVWEERQHTESVMALALSPDETFVVSVAADRQVVRYEVEGDSAPRSITSNSAGHASVAVRHDGLRIAVGGWDGCIRVYTERLEQLASLRYHKDTVQALSFVQHRALATTDIDRDDDESDSDSDDASPDHTAGLLVSGGKEGRICLWQT